SCRKRHWSARWSLPIRCFLAFEARGHQVAFAPLTQHLHRPEIDERSELKGERHSYYQIGRWAPDRATIAFVGTRRHRVDFTSGASGSAKWTRWNDFALWRVPEERSWSPKAVLLVPVAAGSPIPHSIVTTR